MKLVYGFPYFYYLWKNLKTILNKHKEWYWFLYILFEFINTKCFFYQHVFVFCFGTEIGTENRGFSLVSVPNTEIGTENRGFSLVSVPNTEIGTENRGFSLVSVPNTEIGTENRGFSLVSVPNTEILVPWQHYFDQLISVNFPVIHNYWISAFLFLYIRTHIPQFLASQIFKKHSVTQNTHQRWPKLLEHLTDLKIWHFLPTKHDLFS